MAKESVKKKAGRKAAYLTLSFLLSQQLLSQPHTAYTQVGISGGTHTGTIPKIEVPQELGRIIEEVPGHFEPQPLIIHIQNAHGNYEAQKNIQGLLKYFFEAYHLKLILLEGAAGRLEPEVLRFFPNHPELNLKIADSLAKEAELSGPELFLIEEMGEKKNGSKIDAYGIEEVSTYRKNRRAFQQVLRAEEKGEIFLQGINSEINRLTAPYLNSSLKNFLRQVEAYETKRIGFVPWLHLLKKEARHRLGVDLDDPYYQDQWPALIRFFRFEKIDSELNFQSLDHEKKKFIEKLKSLKIDYSLIRKMECVLDSPKKEADRSSTLPYPGLLKAYEELMAQLPTRFSFRSYKNVKLYLQLLVIRHEMKGPALFEETERLQSQLVERLTQTETEKKLVTLFKDFRLLEKLFALELRKRDFQELIRRQHEIEPTQMVNRFININHEKRVKNVKFSHLKEVDRLFALAFTFYRGAQQRDGLMAQNVLKTMKEMKQDRAVIVTGGFHAEGMKQYFEGNGLSYFLVSPRITQASDTSVYHRAMLEDHSKIQTSKIENVLKLMSFQMMKAEGANLDHVRMAILRALFQNPETMRLAKEGEKLLKEHYHIEILWNKAKPKDRQIEVYLRPILEDREGRERIIRVYLPEDGPVTRRPPPAAESHRSEARISPITIPATLATQPERIDAFAPSSVRPISRYNSHRETQSSRIQGAEVTVSPGRVAASRRAEARMIRELLGGLIPFIRVST